MAMPQQLVQAWTAWDQKVSGTTFAVLKVRAPILPPPLALDLIMEEISIPSRDHR
tara:strand:- start:580 stop:744 length:165 start_codon:yes stop_codon:yes gene_type:complete